MDQAQKNDAASAAPRPFPLGERTLLLSPPTLAQRAGIAAEGRRLLGSSPTPIALLVNDPAFKLLPAACQVEATREAAKVQVSGESRLDGFALAEELGKPQLLAFAVWLLAHANHPGLKLEEVRPAITEDNAGVMFAEFVRASGILDLGPNSVGGSG